MARLRATLIVEPDFFGEHPMTGVFGGDAERAQLRPGYAMYGTLAGETVVVARREQPDGKALRARAPNCPVAGRVGKFGDFFLEKEDVTGFGTLRIGHGLVYLRSRRVDPDPQFELLARSCAVIVADHQETRKEANR